MHHFGAASVLDLDKANERGKEFLLMGRKQMAKHKLLFGQLQDCVLPSSLSFKVYTPHSHQGFRALTV